MSRIVILAEGSFQFHAAKTAVGVIRYSKDTVVAVIDSTKAGQDVAQALQTNFGTGIPIVRDIREALPYQPDTLLIGIAPRGGNLPAAWRWQLLTAIEAGMNIVSGLHFFLSDDEELRQAAEKHGVMLYDVRRPPEKKVVANYTPHRAGSHTILAVGSDCSTGKMTTMLELEQTARQRGLNSAFVATGQTGIMISGNGLPIDHIICDFLAGMVEEMVLDFCEKYDWVFVEGQGALNHPGYSPVTLGLLHGTLPDAMIFCHIAGATTIDGYQHCPLPSLPEMIRMNEDVVNWLHPHHNSKVVGISLLTHHLSEAEARAEIQRIEQETGLPTVDVLRFGADPLVDAIQRHFNA
uniref:DUF1611 domain-containing protein n=1 Tax=Thermosporothrix sp. COM3 TaxID=2490863 RepID=A0A455SL29_9CHLR|nr:hypothetical protein KTC_39240 [Thermosporothrix sp. COM3]